MTACKTFEITKLLLFVMLRNHRLMETFYKLGNINGHYISRHIVNHTGPVFYVLVTTLVSKGHGGHDKDANRSIDLSTVTGSEPCKQCLGMLQYMIQKN